MDRPPITERFPGLISPLTKTRIERDTLIGDNVFIHLSEFWFGRGSQLNYGSSLTGGGKIIIGKNVVVSYGVRLITGTDNWHGEKMNDASPKYERNILRGEIDIDDDCFIGANSVVCISSKRRTIKLGKGSVIAALSYIDKDIPSWTIALPRQELAFKKRPRGGR